MNKSLPVLSKQNKETVRGTQAVFADNNGFPWSGSEGMWMFYNVRERLYECLQ